jgi:hypothetical protein
MGNGRAHKLACDVVGVVWDVGAAVVIFGDQHGHWYFTAALGDTSSHLAESRGTVSSAFKDHGAHSIISCQGNSEVLLTARPMYTEHIHTV